MKRIIGLLLCLALAVTLCGCTEKRTVMGYAKTCLAGIRTDGRNPQVFIMKYTSRRELSDEVLDTEMYTELPQRGYAILFHAYVSGDPFSDSYAFFLDMDGKLQLSFDYEESNRLFDKYYSSFSPYNTQAGEIALMHLQNCNYVSGMINYADDVCQDLASELEANTWYCLSEDELKWVW